MQLLRVIKCRTAGSAQHLQELRNFDLSKSGQGFICGKSTIHRSNAEELANPSMYGTHTTHYTVKLSFQGALTSTVHGGIE